ELMVPGHGGVLLETLKNLSFHLDIGPNDRFMWFTTTGWMMWNSQVGALMVGATACVYDGSPNFPDLGVLWRFAEETGMQLLGASAAYFDACRKADIEPRRMADTSRIVTVGSTGSPLSADTYHWIMQRVNDNAMIASV